MIVLTKEQAFEILDNLIESDMIGHGSSRAVYDYVWNGKPCVVKIGVDVGGHNQNVLEVNVYNEHCGRGRFLAEIYARYGNLMLVCEKVSPLNSSFAEGVLDCGLEADSEINYYDSDTEDYTNMELWKYYDFRSYEECDKLIDKMREVYWELEEIQGCTSDNEQLGIAEDGSVVAYDYGYDIAVDHTIVGCIYNWVNRKTVLDECYEQVEWSEDGNMLELEDDDISESEF